MRLLHALVLTAALVATPALYASGATTAQLGAAVHARIDLRKATPRPEVAKGPVLVGPQPALELEWHVANHNDGTLEIPSPATVLRLRVMGQGNEIPARIDWAATMTLQTTVDGAKRSTSLSAGAATVPGDSSLSIRASVRRLDKAPFAAGDYVLTLVVNDLPLISPEGTRRVRPVDVGFPINLRILALDSAQRQREFHMIEGGFYIKIDSDRSLEHYVALSSMPGAQWSDSLPLAHIYAYLGRHRDAVVVFRRILPDLIRGLDSPAGERLNAPHLHEAARSFAIEGDVTTAAYLLQLEKRTPKSKIPAQIEQWRKAVAKP